MARNRFTWVANDVGTLAGSKVLGATGAPALVVSRADAAAVLIGASSQSPAIRWRGNIEIADGEEDFGTRTFCNSCGKPFNIPEKSELEPQPEAPEPPAPDHPRVAEDVTVKDGYQVELLYETDKGKEGSWVAICDGPDDTLYVSAQYMQQGRGQNATKRPALFQELQSRVESEVGVNAAAADDPGDDLTERPRLVQIASRPERP